jgi:hypothetical protein
MMKIVLSFMLAAAGAFAQATAEPAGAPPAGIDPAVAAMLQKDGIKIVDGGKTVMELWFRSSTPKGTNTSGDNITFTNVPHGTFMGVVRFAERGSDRRGTTVKPGVYTMRLSFFPPDGNHQGVAPQRDFLVLSAAAEDKDPKTTPAFEALIAAARKVSGTAHPTVFSVWKAEGDGKTAVTTAGEHDQVLTTKVGDLPISMIVVGRADH